MKHRTSSYLCAALLVAFVLSLSAVNAFAQEAAQVTGDAIAAVAESAPAQSWQLGLITVITPMIIAGIKLVLPKLPKVWLPIAAPVVGLLLDLLLHFTAGTQSNPWLALGFGAAGVALREAQKQIKAAVAPFPPAMF